MDGMYDDGAGWMRYGMGVIRDGCDGCVIRDRCAKWDGCDTGWVLSYGMGVIRDGCDGCGRG